MIVKYQNPKLPAVIRTDVENAIQELLEHKQLKLYLECKYNSRDHIHLASYQYVKRAIYPILTSDAALDDLDVLDVLQEKDGFDNIYRHALAWLVPALISKWRK